MGERLPCTEEVRGSSPLISTTEARRLTKPHERVILFFAREKARSMIRINNDGTE
jgi:hypothetical protein